MRQLFHGSMDRIEPGTVLRARAGYAGRWGHTDFYAALEAHRPRGCLAHREAVFMCAEPDDIDLAGGGTVWLLTVRPLGGVERHDLNWSSEVSLLADEGRAVDDPAVAAAARNYWAGEHHPNESVWEYLARAALVLAAEAY